MKPLSGSESLTMVAPTSRMSKHDKIVDVNHVHDSLPHVRVHRSVLKATAQQHEMHLTGDFTS